MMKFSNQLVYFTPLSACCAKEIKSKQNKDRLLCSQNVVDACSEHTLKKHQENFIIQFAQFILEQWLKKHPQPIPTYSLT